MLRLHHQKWQNEKHLVSVTIKESVKPNVIYQVTLVAQLGVIGGTMGLFTGFSILSGIEIVYFAAKIFLKKIKRYESKASIA